MVKRPWASTAFPSGSRVRCQKVPSWLAAGSVTASESERIRLDHLGSPRTDRPDGSPGGQGMMMICGSLMSHFSEKTLKT
jgi:hypothetical protein